MIVSLEQFKDHLLIEQDIKDDDLYLLDLLTVAEDAVKKRLNITDCECAEPSATLIQSILILGATLYANRESVAYQTAVNVPHTLDFLFGLDKNYDDNKGRR